VGTWGACGGKKYEMTIFLQGRIKAGNEKGTVVLKVVKKGIQ
jgi:hypothetical protein